MITHWGSNQYGWSDTSISSVNYIKAFNEMTCTNDGNQYSIQDENGVTILTDDCKKIINSTIGQVFMSVSDTNIIQGA